MANLVPVLVATLIVAFAHPAAAQTVQGRLLDGETGAPVEGVLVVLLRADGSERDRYLTNAAGGFRLEAREAGTYTVRAERIGFATVSSDPFTLGEGQVHRLSLETGQEAIRLEGITVQGEARCVVRPEEGLQLARVWDEARKALSVQDWTEREGMYRFRIARYTREMDPNARRVLEESRTVSTGLSRSPIRSLPAEELMSGGFVRDNPDGSLQYFGPDAATLLSDIFLDTHCFELQSAEDRPDLLGLAFRPVGRQGLRDIRGTLWLDRASSALQFLEYRYTWAPHPEARGVANGRVEFERLPGGAWIVSRWWIRMPRLGRGRARASQWERPGIGVAGLRETGGEVLRVSGLDGRSVTRAAEMGQVAGLVWDSTRSGPLEGARVFLSGTTYAGITDAEGRFAIDGVPGGVFGATFTHPRLDSLLASPRQVGVEVSPGERSEVRLAVSSMGSIIAEACRGESRDERTAVIRGVVLDEESGRAMQGATVSFAWQVVSRTSVTFRADDTVLEATTDGEGRFTVCNVPADELLDVHASVTRRRSEVVRLRVAQDSYTAVTLEVRGGGAVPR